MQSLVLSEIDKKQFKKMSEPCIDVWYCMADKSTEQLTGMLGAYYHELAAAEINKGKYGKPESVAINFNISNTKGLSVIALCNYCSIGIDCEFINPVRNVENTLEALFSSAEQKYCGCNGQKAPTSGFYKIWTLKEAVSKYQGSSVWFADKVEITERIYAAERKWGILQDLAVWSAIFMADYRLAVAVKEKPEIFRLFRI